MTSESMQSENIRIGITISDDFRSLMSENILIDRCGAYLKEMLQAFGLPDDVAITVTPPAPLPDNAGIRLTIRESPVTIWSPPVNDEESLIQAICHALYRCRTLLIDDDMVKWLWSHAFPGFYPDMSGDCETALLGYCRGMVRLGKKPKLPLKWKFIGSSSIKDDIEKVFEEEMAREPLSISLRLSPEQYARCFDASGNSLPLPEDENDFPAMLRTMNDGLFWELGLVYLIDRPMPDSALQAPWFRIKWNNIMTPPIKGLRFDEFLVNDSVEDLDYFNLKGVPCFNPANDTVCSVVEGGPDERKKCRDAGLTTWGPGGFIVLWAGSEVRRNAGAFVSHNLTKLYEAQLRKSSPELVNQVTNRFGMHKLTQVLRLLISEQISIRDLRSILEAMLAVNSITTADMSENIVLAGHCGLACPVTSPCPVEDLHADDITDCVRITMKRFISNKYSGGGNTLAVYLLSPLIEKRMRNNEPLSLEERKSLIDAAGAEIVDPQRTYRTPVILTTHEIRRRIRNTLELDFPFIAVLSYQELSPDMNIQPIARIECELGTV